MADQRTSTHRDLTRQLGYLLRVAQSNVWRDLVTTFEPLGVKPQQYAAMALLDRGPHQTLDALARALGMKSPNLVAMIEDLASRGLVTKERSVHDRRLILLCLTAKGQDLLARLRDADDVHERALADLLGGARVAALAEDLRKLATFSSRQQECVERRQA